MLNVDRQLDWKWHSSMGVFDSFWNWNVLSLLPDNLISCLRWFLEWLYWSLKLTQYYSNTFLTTYLLLTNQFWFTLVSICFSWQLGEKGWLCSKYITFHPLSQLTRSYNLNKNRRFIQKSRVFLKSKFK